MFSKTIIVCACIALLHLFLIYLWFWKLHEFYALIKTMSLLKRSRKMLQCYIQLETKESICSKNDSSISDGGEANNISDLITLAALLSDNLLQYKYSHTGRLLHFPLLTSTGRKKVSPPFLFIISSFLEVRQDERMHLHSHRPGRMSDGKCLLVSETNQDEF